jgi:hypothetical protein
MCRKINYIEPKVKAITDMLTECKFSYVMNKDSIDVTVNESDKKRVVHEVYKIFDEFKSPPMSVQWDNVNLLSIFDTRL